jgi:replication initiation and membrane attachment protein DnaB
MNEGDLQLQHISRTMNEGDLQLQNISRTLNECDLQLEQQKIVKTSNEELTESETKLIKDVIMSDQKLVDLVIEYRATVDRISKHYS